MTLGDASHIDPATRDAYSQTGASHVLSLSGLHLSILFGFIKLFILDRCASRRLRAAGHALTILALWAYALLAGLPVSLVRSTIMYSLLILAGLSNRTGGSLNSLASAALLILLASPLALFDVSFQLSFLSVASILLILPLLTPQKSNFLTRALTSFVTLPACAQLAVAPLVAYYFQSVPLYFLPANLIAVPAAGLILYLALPFFLIPIDGARSLIGQLMDGTADAMNRLLAAIASWPGSHIQFQPTTAGVFLSYLTLTAAVLLLHKRQRWCAYLFVTLLTLTLCTELVAHGSRSIY